MSTSDTTYLRDMSHYDTDTALAGYAGTTHKITEGTGYIDPKYASRMNGYRTGAQGKVLGSYHVLHTADPAGQLDFWIRQQDKLTPWWRDWPHWIMQIDAEKWPTDNVPASTVLAFARMLKAANLPGLQVCYASRGQFGDSLAGIPLDLWNAAYRSSSYPGNGSPDWRPYSGRTPVFLQYTSTPYDKNAFRGSVADLLAYIEGGDVALTDADKIWIIDQMAGITVFDKPQSDGTPTSKIGRLALTQGIPNGTEPAAADGSHPRAQAWQVIEDLGAEVVGMRRDLDALAAGALTIPQAQLDLAVLNALKTLAGGQA